MTGPLWLLLADDHPVVRAGLRAVLTTDPGIDVVGEAADPDEAVAAASALRPDVVLMDLRFGTIRTGVDATRDIRALPHPPAVLVLTTYDTDAEILAAIEAGAGGYLLKDAPPDDLIAAVRAAAAGETALGPAIAARLVERVRAPRLALTARELEVRQLVADGHGNAAIAARLFVSESTIKTHLAHINDKLGVTSRSAAIAAARTAGILA